MSTENAATTGDAGRFVPATERFETDATDEETAAAERADATAQAKRLAALGASVFLAAGGGFAALFVLRALLGGDAGTSAPVTPAFGATPTGDPAVGAPGGGAGVGLLLAFGGVAGVASLLGPALATVSGALVGRTCDGTPREAARVGGVGAAAGFLGFYLAVAVVGAAFTPGVTAGSALALGVVVPLVGAVAATAGAAAYARRRYDTR